MQKVEIEKPIFYGNKLPCGKILAYKKLFCRRSGYEQPFKLFFINSEAKVCRDRTEVVLGTFIFLPQFVPNQKANFDKNVQFRDFLRNNLIEAQQMFDRNIQCYRNHSPGIFGVKAVDQVVIEHGFVRSVAYPALVLSGWRSSPRRLLLPPAPGFLSPGCCVW